MKLFSKKIEILWEANIIHSLNGGLTLKKPNSLVQLLGYIFMIIGPVFICFGYLNKVGVLPTTTNSKGDPSVIFPIIGIIFLVVGVVFFFIPLYKEKKGENLQSTGIRVQGIVTGTKKLIYTQWRRQTPYVIYFTYEYSGERYKGRSYLLWNEPNVSEGDIITVYIDKHKNHHYFAEL